VPPEPFAVNFLKKAVFEGNRSIKTVSKPFREFHPQCQIFSEATPGTTPFLLQLCGRALQLAKYRPSNTGSIRTKPPGEIAQQNQMLILMHPTHPLFLMVTAGNRVRPARSIRRSRMSWFLFFSPALFSSSFNFIFSPCSNSGTHVRPDPGGSIRAKHGKGPVLARSLTAAERKIALWRRRKIPLHLSPRRH